MKKRKQQVRGPEYEADNQKQRDKIHLTSRAARIPGISADGTPRAAACARPRRRNSSLTAPVEYGPRIFSNLCEMRDPPPIRTHTGKTNRSVAVRSHRFARERAIIPPSRLGGTAPIGRPLKGGKHGEISKRRKRALALARCATAAPRASISRLFRVRLRAARDVPRDVSGVSCARQRCPAILCACAPSLDLTEVSSLIRRYRVVSGKILSENEYLKGKTRSNVNFLTNLLTYLISIGYVWKPKCSYVSFRFCCSPNVKRG